MCLERYIPLSPTDGSRGERFCSNALVLPPHFNVNGKILLQTKAKPAKFEGSVSVKEMNPPGIYRPI